MGEVFTKVVLVLSIYGICLFLVNKFTRKWLNVEKKKFFSYNHVNNKHKKIDWTIRITFIFSLIIGGFINISRGYSNHIWFLETHILLLVFVIVSETARIIMEKRYAENKNDYIFTAIQLVVISIFLISVFSTNFFGLFE